MRTSEHIILVSGLGTSPAVLTETVWALAHQDKPVIPDEVTVLTTKSGKEALLAAIMSGKPSIWEQLKSELHKEKIPIEGRLLFGETSIRVIPDEKGDEAGDLRTGADNLRAADFMLGELRRYTETPGTTVLCSIAGGRKTMSAILFSCMSLLGREQDKVYHVLIPPEYECGMKPSFFFPQKRTTHLLLSQGKPTGKKVASSRISIELFEVPFVRMRGWYQEKFKTIPPSYRTLISKVQNSAPPAVACPEIEIDAWNGWVKVDNSLVPLSRPCFAILVLLAGGCAVKDIHAKLLTMHKIAGAAKCDWLASFQEGARFADERNSDDVNKVMSELRKKFSLAGFTHVETLVPQRGRAVAFPLKRIKWLGREKLADICGNLFTAS